jgi:hypothetical protein
MEAAPRTTLEKVASTPMRPPFPPGAVSFAWIASPDVVTRSNAVCTAMAPPWRSVRNWLA